MFKLESYLTPWIVQKLSKYVKNFRQEDLQMSLWGGEMALQNLELRLEEIEEEFDLPVHLLSGHINELKIQIPWTKPMTEQTRIHIDTIEFLLKSKEFHHKPGKKAQDKDKAETSDDASASGSTKKKDEETTLSRLVERIVNNINATCENVILKFIDQDIVLSLNLHFFNISSANDKWAADIEDISMAKVMSRKVISILYLSLCLDKHNASGQIDAFHEPILHRCSLECRILRSYSAQTKNKCSTTRIAVFTNAIDLNLSSMQVPMLLRCIKAALAIIDSENNVHEMRMPCVNVNEQSPLCITEDIASEKQTESEKQSQSPSYFSWAWNFVPKILYGRTEEEEYCPGHIIELGVYVEQLTFSMKNSEYATDASVGGVTVVSYKPILELIIKGAFFEIVQVKEIDWNNVKVGITNIVLKPLDPTKKNIDYDAILELGPGNTNQLYLDKSLFDKNYKTSATGWIVTNYKDYIKRFTDAYLLRRGPVFAFDLIEYCSDIEAIDENIDPAKSANVEKRCLHKQIRVMGTGVVLRYNETYLKKKNTPMFEFSACRERAPQALRKE